MTRKECNAAISIASILSLRMLGLFMILPIFSLYAHSLAGTTPLLIGLAIGGYGLTQAILQIPFGMASDRIGRKTILTIGLLLFAGGSIIAAMATSIHGVILGRLLQGAGAIGSTATALVADLTDEQNRTKAMAIIGLTVGVAFTIAMVLGPILNRFIAVPGIFWLTAGFAMISLVLLFTWVPTPKQVTVHRDAETVPSLLLFILKDRELLRFDFGIMASHAILAATFVVLPIALTQSAGMSEQHQWSLYLPVLALAFFAMLPMIIIAEKRRQMKGMLLLAIGLITVSEFCLWYWHHSAISIGLWLFIFFTAFSFLEASLPSLVSKQAPAGTKGTAMGIYSSSQYAGIFVGGAIGGWLYGQHHFASVFLACAGLALCWMLIATRMQQPRYLATQMLKVGNIDDHKATQLTQELQTIPGVAEAVVIAKEGVAYLKVDKKVIDQEALLQFSASQ